MPAGNFFSQIWDACVSFFALFLQARENFIHNNGIDEYISTKTLLLS
jgi:hypothetical protein